MAIDMGPPPAGGTHGVVVIHGIGEPEPGATLASVVNPLAEYLLERGARVRQAMEVGAAGGAAEAVIDFAPPAGAGGQPQRWLFREAYWARVFQPPTLQEFMRWAVRHAFGGGGLHLRAVLNGLFAALRDAGNQQPDRDDPSIDYERVPVSPTEPRARAFVKQGLAQVDSAGRPLWVLLPRRRQAPGGKALQPVQIPLGGPKVAIASWVTFALTLAVLPPLVAALVMGWFLLLLPPVPGIAGLQRRLSASLDDFFLNGMGDANRFVEHLAWASAIRNVLETEVKRLLDDSGVADVTIIAHSLGAVIAYDALQEEGGLGAFIAADPVRRKKRITFVSLGAGLNRGWRLAKDAPVAGALKRFLRPVDPTIAAPLPWKPADLASGFKWVYIYARYDPVSAGPLDAEVWHSSRLDPSQLKHRRVINRDSPLSDHSAYWENRWLVVPRLAEAISGDYPWPGLSLSRDQAGYWVRRQVKGALALVWARGLLTGLVVANLAFMAGFDWWWTHVRDAFLALPKLQPVIAWFDQPLGLGLNLQTQALWLLVAALTLSTALGLYRLASELRQVFDDLARAQRFNT